MRDNPPILSRNQAVAVDRLAVSELGIPSIVLMENAGKNAAAWIHNRYNECARTVHVFCGTGNNGGDGFVIARHLHNAGMIVRVLVVGDIDRFTPDALTNHAIVAAMKLPVDVLGDAEAIRRSCAAIGVDDLIVDALLGTGVRGDVREPTAEAIGAINAAGAHGVVAVDVPSGLDCDMGTVGNVVVRADATVTFVAAKLGFTRDRGPGHVGELVVVNIGTPPELTQRVTRLALGHTSSEGVL